MKLAEMTWREVAAARDAVALLPLGATEQHGPHLPAATDTLIVSAIAERVEARMPGRVVLCPALAFGSSHHHLAFGATLSLRAELFTGCVLDLVESLAQSGFERIVLLNGHGGNITPARQALALVTRNERAARCNIALATYWEMAGGVFAGEPPMESPALSHACEYETSLMLHLYPSAVRPASIERARRPQANAWVGWEDEMPYRGVTSLRRTEALSNNGSSGEPQLATAEKGRHLFDAAVSAVESFLADFISWPLPKDLRNA